MRRRRWLQWGCAQCALLSGAAAAQTAWAAPPRFTKPDVTGDEGGLWALMDREETRVRRSPFRMRDEALERYLADTVCRLAGEHCPDARVYAMRVPYFNASMSPNGMMQVWSGLLLRVENEAQLAAILSHELGHYLQRHSMQQLRDAKARSAFALALAPLGIYGLIGQLAVLGSAYAFSRDQEREADAVSVVLMRSRGYDTREAPKVWAHLLAEVQAGPGKDVGLDSVLLATHPSSEERRATLERESADGSGELGGAAYRARLAPLRFMLLEDEIKRGRYGESLVLLNRLVAGDRDDADLLYFRGEAYRLRGNDGDAVLALADFEAAARSERAPAATWRSLGQLHQAQARPEAARDAWHRYLAVAPTAPDAELVKQTLEGIK